MALRLHFGASMKLFTLALVLVSSVASAQDTLAVVIDAELNARHLRREIARETHREVVADPLVAREVIAISRAGVRRWTLHYRRGDVDAIQTVEARPGRLYATLSGACVALLSTPDPEPAPLPPAPETVPPPPADEEIDLVDPFGGIGFWDPLADALEGELIQPFHHAPRWSFVSIIDPFAAPEGWIDLDDPWAP